MSNSYDYIVVGAGSAGCVMANRLSADPSNRVALIEAGPSDRKWPVNFKTAIPIGSILLLPHARYNWQYNYAGGPSIKSRTIPCPRGKLLGGCSSLNGAIYIRGDAQDYNDWEALGNEGWSFKEVLPAFIAQEKWHGAPSPWHGVDGELDNAVLSQPSPITEAFLLAAHELGHQVNDDFNGETQLGFGLWPINQRNGVRASSSRAFLHGALKRPNLDLYDETMVEKIEIKDRRAIGLALNRAGKQFVLRCDREVILSAGAINTPQLLMLSGIGPAAELTRLGIEVLADLPGVGQNLQDHPTVSITMDNPSGESYALTSQSVPRIVSGAFQYLIGRSGMLTSNAVEAGGFVCSPASPHRPDLQFGLMLGLRGGLGLIPRRHGCLMHTVLLRPHSRGSLTLASRDPFDKPILNYDMLNDKRDVDALVYAVREARRILRAPALRPFLQSELFPGAGLTSDEELIEAIRENVNTAFHPVGTCRMGPENDPLAVVDPQLRVRGLERLRIVDASIMPTVISGNTSAPVMMIAERAAGFVLGNRVQRDAA